MHIQPRLCARSNQRAGYISHSIALLASFVLGFCTVSTAAERGEYCARQAPRRHAAASRATAWRSRQGRRRPAQRISGRRCLRCATELPPVRQANGLFTPPLSHAHTPVPPRLLLFVLALLCLALTFCALPIDTAHRHRRWFVPLHRDLQQLARPDWECSMRGRPVRVQRRDLPRREGPVYACSSPKRRQQPRAGCCC